MSSNSGYIKLALTTVNWYWIQFNIICLRTHFSFCASRFLAMGAGLSFSFFSELKKWVTSWKSRATRFRRALSLSRRVYMSTWANFRATSISSSSWLMDRCETMASESLLCSCRLKCKIHYRVLYSLYLLSYSFKVVTLRHVAKFYGLLIFNGQWRKAGGDWRW